MVEPVITQDSLVTEQLSPVVGFGVITAALQDNAAVFCAILSGQMMVGNWLSVMVTLKLHTAVFPEASFAV